MGNYSTIDVQTDKRGVTRLTLDRPEARNAMSQEMIRELATAVQELAGDDAVRAVVLSGAGDVFCAGGDLKGMKQQAGATREGRIRDATEFAKTLAALDVLPKPVIGRINGSAFGGGLGLISICDAAIGVSTSKYRLTEVTLGLIPAVISPYVVARLGVPNSRRVMLFAHEIRGDEAARLGLLSEVVEPDRLDEAVEREVDKLLRCAPSAVADAKRLIQFVSTHDTQSNIEYTARALADAWESDAIREGIDAFLNKRKPKWSVVDG